MTKITSPQMPNYLYYNVLNLPRLLSIIALGYIPKHEKLGCVCLTRDKYCLSSRGIKIVLDRNKLKHRYKIIPFSYKGWLQIHKPYSRFKPMIDEMEERCYNNIDLKRCCVRIEII